MIELTFDLNDVAVIESVIDLLTDMQMLRSGKISALRSIANRMRGEIVERGLLPVRRDPPIPPPDSGVVWGA